MSYPGYSEYKEVAEDAGGNITYAFIGAGIIWVISKVWFIGAKILFWIALAVIVLSIFYYLINATLGLFLTLSSPRTSKWIVASIAARTVDVTLSLVALWLAARTVGYWP